jgi:hypothetical protein
MIAKSLLQQFPIGSRVWVLTDPELQSRYMGTVIGRSPKRNRVMVRIDDRYPAQPPWGGIGGTTKAVRPESVEHMNEFHKLNS